MTEDNAELVSMTADIVSAFVANNKVNTGELGELIATVHAALANTSTPPAAEAAAPVPALSVRSSIKHEYIVCLEDGKKLKMLKRYLRTNYDMSPEEYRAKWGLPRDYPMVAPAYAEQRRGLAVTIGLGRKSKEVTAAAADAGKAVAVKGKKTVSAAAAKVAAAAHLSGE